jgi:hypothetical protein
MKQMLFSIVIVFMLLVAPLVVEFVVNATPEWDCDEDYIDIPGACRCWNAGYTDGIENSFNQTKDGECRNKGNQYFMGFDTSSNASASLNFNVSGSTNVGTQLEGKVI